MNERFQMQGGKKLDFAEIDQCKQVLLGLSLAGNLVKALISLNGTEWTESGYGMQSEQVGSSRTEQRASRRGSKTSRQGWTTNKKGRTVAEAVQCTYSQSWAQRR